MPTELLKSLASGKNILFILVAWGLPIGVALSIWWLVASDAWFSFVIPTGWRERIATTGLSGGWILFIAWLGATLLLGLNARSFFRLYEGYPLPSRIVARRRDLYWLRREVARSRERVQVAERRVHAGDAHEADGRSLDDLRIDASDAEAALKSRLGVVGRIMEKRPWRIRLNWRDVPVLQTQMMPTALGNRIRAFERYGNARYGLDILILWYEFSAQADERSAEDLTASRQNVELYLASSVCALLLSIVAVIPLLWRDAWYGNPFSLLVVSALAAITAVVAYHRAVAATSEWGLAVAALVNTKRAAVAKAFGFSLPTDLDSEKRFWRAINGFVRTGGDAWTRELDSFSRATHGGDPGNSDLRK